MTSASGRLEQMILKIQNFRDLLRKVVLTPAETATTEWVIIVGNAIS
jgi:hypothetical protein